jgi:hypothetical protein
MLVSHKLSTSAEIGGVAGSPWLLAKREKAVQACSYVFRVAGAKESLIRAERLVTRAANLGSE